MYYTDPKDPGTEHPNRCKSFHTPGYHHLTKVKNCPIAGTTLRLTARITGEPDTWFSIPAKIQYKRKNISGFVSSDEEGFHFVPYQYGKNYYILNQK
jgi:hypothetical protein